MCQKLYIMKMKKYFILALSVLTISACTQKSAVTGKIEGLTNDTIFVMRMSLHDLSNVRDEFADTILAKKDGSFAYNPEKKDTSIYMFIPRQEIFVRHGGNYYISNLACLTVLLTPDEKINVQVPADRHVAAYTANGSQFNASYGEAVSGWIDLEVAGDEVEKDIDSLFRLPVVPRDVVQSKVTVLRKLLPQIRDRKIEYIKQHPDNIVSGYLLTSLPNNEAEKLLPTLTDRVKNSEIKPLLDFKTERILIQRQKDDAAEKVIVGAIAPDFTLENSEGNNFSLSSLRGKPVVLDFWGTWCGYCIKGIPDMKKYYDKYYGKVEFVSIDCGDKKENWIAALEKYDMTWIHVYNDKEGADDLSVKYDIRGFPTKYILDEDGIILAVFIGETPEFYQKMDSIFGKR